MDLLCWDPMRRHVIAAAVLLGSASLAAAEEPRPVTTHYYGTTLTIDAVSIAMFFTGNHYLGDHDHESTGAGIVMTAGAFGAAFGAPIVHLARGHTDRFLESWLLRGSLAGVGMVVGVETAQCGDLELLCGFDRMGPGAMAGLAVASVLDAMYLTDETEALATWAPQVSASSHGAQVGFITTF